MKKIADFLYKHQIIIGFLLIWLIAFSFRNSIAERDLQKLEQATNCRFAPFLVESAIMYSYMNKFADGEDISAVDPALPAMSKYPVAEQMSLSLEYAGGWMLKLYRKFYGVPSNEIYERSYAESRFIRRWLSLYIALAPALIYLMLKSMKLPWFWAAAGAALEIFSAAALGRYTGQDLIKGAFAWPILSGILCCYAAVIHGSVIQRKTALIAVGLLSFSAVASWDASQMIIGLLAVSDIIFFLNYPSYQRRDFWLMSFIGMMSASLLVPYCQAHGTAFSPVLLWIIPTAILIHSLKSCSRRKFLLPAAMLGPGIIWALAVKLSTFGGNYGHFAELLSAKLKFLNKLPSDPTLLTFDQRYLWTPELHSASWKMTQMIYPAGLWMLFILIAALSGYLLFKRLRGSCLSTRQLIMWKNISQFTLLTAISFIMYIFMARFRDITILFASITLPLALHFAAPRRYKTWFYILAAVTVLMIAAEWHNSRHLRRGYPEGLQQTAGLIKFLRQHNLQNLVFLSDMQTSSYLKGYTNASILVQPKYELPEVRELTYNFIWKLFNSNIDEFAVFCAENKIDYLLLHVPMVTTPGNIPYSYRYMACAVKLRSDCAAIKLAGGRGSKNFCAIPLEEKISGINGYRLYKFIPEQQYQKALALTEQAWEAYYLNQRRRARKLIRQAVKLAPGRGRIYDAYTMITRRIPPPEALPGNKKSGSK